MLLGLGQIVHDALALQMRGKRTAATRLCSPAAVGRCGRILVIGASFAVLRQVFDIDTLSLQFGFEQRQLRP